MPKALEQKLKKEVAGKNWSKERKNAYIYGTLRKTGWKPSSQDGHSPMQTIPMPNGGEPDNPKFLR
jgi:hypothetical protein